MYGIFLHCISINSVVTRSLKEDLGKFTRLLVDTECWHIFVEIKISKALEDLLKCCLTHRVVLKLVLFFELLNQLEQETD